MNSIHEERGWALYACLGALLLAGCGDDDAAVHAPRDAGTTDAGHVAPDESACSESRIGVLRVAAWPGGGLQVALSSAARDSELLRESGARVEFESQAAPQQSGLTALLIVPAADGERHTARIEAAHAFVDALPAGERIAVFVQAEGVPLAAELTERREHVHARLTELAAAPAQPDDASLASDLARVESELAAVSPAWGPLARSVVVIGAELPAAGEERAAASDPSVRMHGGMLQAAIAAPADPVESAVALAERIAEQRGATVLLGACGPFAFGEQLVLHRGDQRCTLQAPAPLEELAALACDARAAASDEYPFSDTIDLVLTPEELAVHDEFAEDENEEEFTLAVAFGDAAPIKARAHFRGQTSLGCDRKSYGIDLDGASARRIAPGIATDEFDLISMCKENAYFRQVVASRMMRSLGLFPLDAHYVRVRVDGRERGVYLLLEKPSEALRADNLDLATVVRRRLEATDEEPEVKYPKPADAVADARARYEALAKTIDDVAPEELEAALEQRLDLDGYLHWLAINSYLHNGDTADEVFFYASSESGASGADWYFRQLAWDSDDLFTDCHHAGKHAMHDEGGLLFCAESNLDRALLVSPAIYERFVSILDDLISVRIPESEIDALLLQTRDELFTHLQDDAVCAAMDELLAKFPDGKSCAEARPYIESEMDAFRVKLHTRVEELRAAIDAWKNRP